MIKEYICNGIHAYLNDHNGHIAYFDKPISDHNLLNSVAGFDECDHSIKRFKDYSVFSIGFNISNQCNLNCSYCFHNKENDEQIDGKFIADSLNDFLRLHPQCRKLFVDLSGHGEPLLSLKLVLEIAKYCRMKTKETGVEIIPNLITNGVLLTKNIADLLQNNGILFGVSIDGDKNVHDKVRIFKKAARPTN